MKKAYSTLNIKAVDEDAREITGIASTPGTDRHDDIVAPEGAEFTLPIPLLWQHRHAEPIGQVVKAKITDKGIEVVARIVAPTDDMPPQMAARLQEAWVSLKTGLVRGLSIGFNPIEYSFMDNGGIHFLKWDWTELSAVTIPANSEATITSVKSFDKKQRAALGKSAVAVVRVKPAGASACVQKNHNQPKPQEGIMKKTIQEQLAEFKATREAKAARMMDIMKTAGEEGVSLDAEQSEEFDNLEAEVEALEKHINRLVKMEKTLIETSTPVSDQIPESTKRYSGIAVHKAPEKLEKGIAFARFAASLGAAKGELSTAYAISQKRFPEDKRLHGVMKAAVDAGTTQDPNWASELVEYNEISQDFIDFLRPKTVIGQFGQNGIPALRSIPFNVHVKGQTSAGSAQWVGEGKLKPLTSSGYSDVHLGFAKIAAISVATDELLRFSNPSAERLIRDDLAGAVIERMDADFMAISSAAIANVKLASITNKLGTYAAGSASPEGDIAALWAAADSGNFDLTSAVYITTPAVARKLSGMTTAADNKRFPEMTPRGGSIEGISVIVSNHADTNSFVLVFASEIWLADDGIVTLDASREASLIMSDAPEVDGKGEGALTPVSMFQTNQVAFRAERYINWQPRRANVVSGVLANAWA